MPATPSFPIISGDTDITIEEGGKLFVPGIGDVDLGACWDHIDCAGDHADLDENFFLRHNVHLLVGACLDPHFRLDIPERDRFSVLLTLRPSYRGRHFYSCERSESDSDVVEIATIPNATLAQVIADSVQRFNTTLLAKDLTNEFIHRF